MAKPELEILIRVRVAFRAFKAAAEKMAEAWCRMADQVIETGKATKGLKETLAEIREEETVDTYKGGFREGDWTAKAKSGEACRVISKEQFREAHPGVNLYWIPVVFPERTKKKAIKQVPPGELEPIEVHPGNFRSGQLANSIQFGTLKVITWAEYSKAKDGLGPVENRVPVKISQTVLRLHPETLRHMSPEEISENAKGEEFAHGGLVEGPVEEVVGAQVDGKDRPECVLPLTRNRELEVKGPGGLTFKIKPVTAREVEKYLRENRCIFKELAESAIQGRDQEFSVGFGSAGEEKHLGVAKEVELTDVSMVPAEQAMEHCTIADPERFGGFPQLPVLGPCTCRAGDGEFHREDCPKSFKVRGRTKEDQKRVDREKALDDLRGGSWEHPADFAPKGWEKQPWASRDWDGETPWEIECRESYFRMPGLEDIMDPVDQFILAFQRTTNYSPPIRSCQWRGEKGETDGGEKS
jgi:hypothetical protein